MTNFPFGFSQSGDDDQNRPDPDPGAGGIPGLPGGIPGLPGGLPGGFDLSQIGSMLSQLGQMMSQAKPSDGPVNYDLAKQLAVSQLSATHPASSVDVGLIRDAVALVEIWLDGVTAFPSGVRTTTAWTPRQWVEATMPSWEQLCSPMAGRVSSAWMDSLPEEARDQVGPIMGIMTSMGGMQFGNQLGQGLAQLAKEVLTSTDVGLPLGPEGTAALLPVAVNDFAKGLDVPEDQVRLYLAAREAAHHRLYAGVPWLRQRVIDLVAEYAKGITVDFSAIEDLAANLDPSNMAELQQTLGQGLLEPTITPGQKSTLAQLETLLALIEGWVDTVVAEAIDARLPGAQALQETLRRRRATGGPAEQTFSTLLGLELRPRRLRAAADLWRDLAGSRGAEGRDALWADPDLLPTSTDLDDPAGFVNRDKEFTELLAGLDDLPDFLTQGEIPTDGPADPDKPDA